MRRQVMTAAFVMLSMTGSALNVAAEDADRPQQIVNEASTTVDVLAKDDSIGPHLIGALRKAKGVLVIPSLLKAGFIIGAAGGSGVLLGRYGDGGWSAPSFITMGEASIGLQIGGSVSEVIFVINSEKAMMAIMDSKVTLGADLEIAVGPIGANIGAQTSLAAGKDVWVFARSQGLFAGGAFDGAYLEPRNDWNNLYYGEPVQARAITTSPTITNPGADALRRALARAVAVTL
jgi:lipid-binding SYLF domain-containing protein